MPQAKPWIEDAEQKLTDYCEHKFPENTRHQIRLSYTRSGNTLTLIEARPQRDRPGEWAESPVAQFKYDPASATWQVYWPRAKDNWLALDGVQPVKSFSAVLYRVEQDETRVFWG